MNAIAEIQEKYIGSPLTGDVAGEAEVLRVLQGRLATMKEQSTQLLGVENLEAQTLHIQTEAVAKEIKRLRLRQYLSEKKCQVLQPEAFALRNHQGLPSMALFTLDSNTSSISLGGLSTFIPGLPTRYDRYEDVREGMREVVSREERFGNWSGAILLLVAGILAGLLHWCYPFEGFLETAGGLIGVAVAFLFLVIALALLLLPGPATIEHRVTWKGIIPPDARTTIKELQALGATVLLFAEVEKWGTIIKPDPLILTIDGDNLVVVGVFDTTPLEKHLELEYTGT